MPYKITKGGCPPSKPWAVKKKGVGGPDGKTLGCHPSRAAASKQIGAIESEERRRMEQHGTHLIETDDGWEVWSAGELVGAYSDQSAAFDGLREVMGLLESSEPRAFRLVFREGEQTVDRRTIDVGAVRFDRQPPLPLMFTRTTGQGHMGATFVGVIDSVERTADGIIGRGRFDDPAHNAEAAEAIRLLESGMLPTWSPDIGDGSGDLVCDPDGEHCVERLTDGVLMGGTIVPFPALDSARIELEAEELVAAGGTGAWSGELAADGQTANAAVVTLTPTSVNTYMTTTTTNTATLRSEHTMAPPALCFDIPEADRPTPLTITPEGLVYGHLATFSQCHQGIRDRCVLAPRSRIDYAAFHQGHVLTAEGETIRVGNLTVGCGHADLSMDDRTARAHYDDAGTVWAQVRARDGAHGVWVSGAVLPDVAEQTITRARACALSGDWRLVGDHLELVAALSVPVPGFPIIASASDELRVRSRFTPEGCTALVAAGMTAPADPTAERIAALEARLVAVEAIARTFAPDAVERWAAGVHDR